MEAFQEIKVETSIAEDAPECSSPLSTASTAATDADLEIHCQRRFSHSAGKADEFSFSHLGNAACEDLQCGTEETGASSGSSEPAVPQEEATHGNAADCMLVSLPRELRPTTSGRESGASSQLIASLMQRVGQAQGSGSRGMSYQVQVSAPLSPSSSQMSASTSSGSSDDRTAMGSESLQSLSESTFSQRRVEVPWALFPYFFDLLPAVDGIPCDGLLMISRLVGLMNQHGFKLRKASRCPHSDAATIIELHGIVSERDWTKFEEMIWVWGIAVMSSRVPLELSPHRSLILDMVS